MRKQSDDLVLFTGNTGMDPEMTVFDTGACVARVSLAVRGKKPALGGDEMSAEDGATTWLDVEAWNDEARQLCDPRHQGSPDPSHGTVRLLLLISDPTHAIRLTDAVFIQQK